MDSSNRIPETAGPIPSPEIPFNTSSILAPPRYFDSANPELIDRPGISPKALRKELESLEKANRRFGGYELVVHYVKRLVRDARLQSLTVLDLGTGIADIPRALVMWGRKRQLPVKVTAVDLNPEALICAREACHAWPEITIEQKDMLRLPYNAGSFDLVISSMALHHFEVADAVALMRRMQQIARTGYIVNDLRRNWWTIWMTEILARTMIKEEIVRHDAEYSSRAAFTIAELKKMAETAGLMRYRIKRHHLIFRMVLEGRK